MLQIDENSLLGQMALMQINGVEEPKAILLVFVNNGVYVKALQTQACSHCNGSKREIVALNDDASMEQNCHKCSGSGLEILCS